MYTIKSLKDNIGNDLFIIKWRVSHRCNLNCSYCNQSHKVTNSLIEEENQLINIAKDISVLMDRVTQNKIKIDLIGGEVSLFNLKAIFENITSTKLYRIQITTNFMKDADYYIQLAEYLNSRNIELSLTASFHYEFNRMDDYFAKVSKVKAYCSNFCCEMVSNVNNQDVVKDFEKHCIQSNLNYMIDVENRNVITEQERKKLHHSSSKKKIRYTAILEDVDTKKCIEKEYISRTDLITDKSLIEYFDSSSIKTKGLFCTNTWDFITIDFNKVMGRKIGKLGCKNKYDIKEYRPIKPFLCQEEKCNLCGRFNLFRRK